MLITMAVNLIAFWILLYMVNAYLPMTGRIELLKPMINPVAIIGAVLYVLKSFDILWLGGMRITLIAALAILGVLLWAINTHVSIKGRTLVLINALILFVAVLAVLQSFAPAPRARRFRATTAAEAVAWQENSRQLLLKLLHLDDLENTGHLLPPVDRTAGIPLNAVVRRIENYDRYDFELQSSLTRKISVILTIPRGKANLPAVVCVHGHFKNRDTVYDEEEQYHCFARHFAQNGFVTISTDVGQHSVFDNNRTLMGERLWDLMRLVDCLCSIPEVDSSRIGVAGLSLGGEMAMWLGAMDKRIKASVSAGFLANQAQMRFHCNCWRFEGFAENFEFADIYSLMAPRPLMLQIGAQENSYFGFPLKVALPVMEEINRAYRCLGHADQAVLYVHPGGHEFVAAPALDFMKRALGKPN